ncbi:hypothetical protein LCGC14_1824870 [marine sediment metagenome]|uniref:Uncharacterized protein n=1 Tax=marine sediment metagenome TaxID=412755 RepID=A0A0F9H616_9ZZZZ
MKLNLSEMAIRKMDRDEVRMQLMDIRGKGTTSDVIMNILRKIVAECWKP